MQKAKFSNEDENMRNEFIARSVSRHIVFLCITTSYACRTIILYCREKSDYELGEYVLVG